MGPRWGQDGAKTLPRGLPETLPSKKRRKKHQDRITNPKISRSVTLLGPILEAQGHPREAQDPPKRGPRAPKRPPKVEFIIDLIF